MPRLDRPPFQLAGHVQPYAFLLAVDAHSRTVVCASDNLATFTGIATEDAMGRALDETLGEHVAHDISNVAMHPDFARMPIIIGAYHIGGHDILITAFEDGPNYILEGEHVDTGTMTEGQVIKALDLSISQVARTRSEDELLNVTLNLMSFVTGMSRVSTFKINGEGREQNVGETSRGYEDSQLGRTAAIGALAPSLEVTLARGQTRYVAEVQSRPVPVWSTFEIHGFDVSARATSVAYLDNDMPRLDGGSVQTSLIVPIGTDPIWGYVLCESAKSRHVDARKRAVVRLIAQLVGNKLERAQA